MFEFNINMISQNVSFTSRSPQIRDAQNVCHNVSVNFPHLSTTRLAPFVLNLEEKFPEVYDSFISANPCAGRFFVPKTAQEKKLGSIFSWVRNLNRELNFHRSNRDCLKGDYQKMLDILSQFRYVRVANCHEDAKLSELVLRARGHKNVYTGRINVGGHDVDHMVCFYNKDGMPFDGKIGKKTIVVDAWLNEADFADNILLKYRNIYKDFLFLPKNGKLSFSNVESLKLKKEELANLVDEFPELL